MPPTPDELRVSEQYWRCFGAAPDEFVMGWVTEMLTAGVPADVLEQSLRSHPAVTRRAAALAEADRYTSASTVLPYRTLRSPGAEVMLVAVPGILIDAAPPTLEPPQGIDTPTHLLSIGMTQDVPCAPRAWQQWADTAADLVRREAASLGVPLSKVVCFGASIQGARALMVGSRAGVGTVVVGAPDVRLGTWFATLRTWTQNNPRSHPAFKLLYEWCDIEAGDVVIGPLDLMVEAACLEATDTAFLGLVSEQDLFSQDVVALFEVLDRQERSAPSGLFRHDYGEHDNVFPPFWALVDEVLSRLSEGQPLPMPGQDARPA